MCARPYGIGDGSDDHSNERAVPLDARGRRAPERRDRRVERVDARRRAPWRTVRLFDALSPPLRRGAPRALHPRRRGRGEHGPRRPQLPHVPGPWAHRRLREEPSGRQCRGRAERSAVRRRLAELPGGDLRAAHRARRSPRGPHRAEPEDRRVLASGRAHAHRVRGPRVARAHARARARRSAQRHRGAPGGERGGAPRGAAGPRQHAPDDRRGVPARDDGRLHRGVPVGRADRVARGRDDGVRPPLLPGRVRGDRPRDESEAR